MKTIFLIGILFFFICAINCNEIPSDTFLFENFQNGFGKWQISKDSKYQGTWSIGEPESDSFVGIKGDSYLVANDAAKHHSIYRKFDKVLDNSANKDLVIQYEVKYQKGLTCGGSYIKLLRSPLEKFGGDSPYIIMFGPDKCGTTNKVHFIFRHYNPVTKVWEEKHLKNAPEIRDNKLTHLYTLRVSSDNSFAIYIDKELATEGNLLESFEPPVNPPKTIDDPSDIKPSNWVDEETIDDPNAKIPEGWDESQPEFINNPDVSKPAGWDESEPENISDPAARKPDDWDDELDGVWVAPSVPNPKCETTGCGKWEAPIIQNPKYMGKYVFPKIKNPAFKGVWKAKQINNPGFYEDLTPYKFDKIDGLGIEIWTMDEKYSFDNFLIGHNLQSALDYAERTWKVKYENELKQEEEQAASSQSEDTLGEIIQFLKDNSTVFVVVGLAFVGVLVFLIIFICRGGDDKKDKDSSDEEDSEEGEEKAKVDDKNPKLRKRNVNKEKDEQKSDVQEK